MSKIITIPTRFGYPTADIFVNNQHYVFPSGVEIEVDDAVAGVIENAIALEPKEGSPSGGCMKLYRHKVSSKSSGTIEFVTARKEEYTSNLTSAFRDALKCMFAENIVVGLTQIAQYDIRIYYFSYANGNVNSYTWHYEEGFTDTVEDF